MSTETLLIITLVLFLAAYVKGVTGLGFSTCALPLLALAIGVKAALPLLIVPSLVSNALVMREAGQFGEAVRRFGLLYLCTVPGVLLGVSWLHQIDSSTAEAVLGSALLAYSIFTFATPQILLNRQWERRLGPLIGASTGIINGLTGSQMMPLLPYLMALQLDSSRFIQAINISFCLSSLVMAVGLSKIGLINAQSASLSLLGLVPVFIGIHFGSHMRRNLSPQVFRRFILATLFVLSLILIARALG